MSDAAYIDDAERWSKELTRMRTRGPGDIDNAMRQVEREYGVDYWSLWHLRYRRGALKNISVSVYMRLRDAYRAECERQMRRLSHELEITKATARPSEALVAEVEAVVGAPDDGQVIV